jgi:hypothetical protein
MAIFFHWIKKRSIIEQKQADVKIEATIGIREPSAWYNPLDRTFIMKTESP